MPLQLLPCTIHPHIVSVRAAHPRMYGGRYVLDCYVKDKFMTCTRTWDMQRIGDQVLYLLLYMYFYVLRF